ncbi:MAG: hypothetical protein ABWY36_03515 [Leifsonia sp.]
MNPLAFWATRDVRMLDHSTDDEALRHQRLDHVEELEPLDRDGRWAAAIHRWAQQDAAAAAADEADRAHAATRARHDTVPGHHPRAVVSGS